MTVILSFPEYQTQAQQLAEALSLPCYNIDIHHFPDSESRVTLPDISINHAIIYCGLEHPNNKLVELLFTVKTLQKQGCQRTSLVTPYLCYMRQDIAFHKGEAISQDIIAHYLADLFDDLITVDAHLHRTISLESIFPATNTTHVSASNTFGHFLKQNDINGLLLGPDVESKQWLKQIANESGLPYLTASKIRHSDKNVSIMLPDGDFSNKTVILVDDVISSASTMITTAELLKKKNATKIFALVTHALFDSQAFHKMKLAGINEIWSSDSIPHPSNKIGIVPLVASHIKNWIS
jgi:ribose-phosphate pyrophosphokinase